MKNVVITGATGFTGSQLADRLVREGHRVTALVRASSDTARLVEAGVRCIAVDLSDGADLLRALGSVPSTDEIFHTAAAFRQQHSNLEEFLRVNVEGTRAVLGAASKVGVGRVVHCSTVGVQGEIDDPPASEDYRAKPGDIYQDTKLEGEQVALEFAGRGLPLSVVRPVGIYGPGDRRFLKLFRPIARRRMVVIGSGETLYHLTFIDDLVDGLLLAARHPAAVGEVFTIAGDRYTTLNDLFALIAQACGVPPPTLRIPYAPVHAAAWLCDKVCRAVGVNPPLYPRRVEFFAKSRAFSIKKAQEILGYRPQVSLEEGLRRTYAWYRSEGLI